jgi:membrane associated rhomboid family serine protease
MLSDREYMYGAPDRGSWFHFGESMVKPLIWANVLVFLLTGAGANERALLLVLLHPYLIQKGEFWRLVTCMFAHGGFMHILFNMWGLYLFGRQLERLIGLRRFAILYFVSGIIGGLVWLSANWHSGHVLLDGQGNVLRISGGLIGASGAVFGVMMAAAIAFPNQVVVLLFPPIPMRLKTFVAAFALVEVLLSLNEGQGKIAHLAHLGGILGGVVCMLGARLPNGGRFRLFAVFRDWGRRWRMAAAQRRLQKELRVEEGGASGLLDMTAEVDRILDKIGEHGLDSLSSEERRTLEHARRHFRERP